MPEREANFKALVEKMGGDAAIPAIIELVEAAAMRGPVDDSPEAERFWDAADAVAALYPGSLMYEAVKR